MRFRFAWAVLVSLSAFAAVPRPALAWNAAGHMAIALIAWRQLEPAEREQVSAILRAHPHYEELLLRERPEDVDAAEWAFLRASIWPDLVRPAAPGTGEVLKRPAITKYHNGPWHVLWTPWVAPQDRAAMNPTTLPAPKEPDAASGYRENLATLSKPDAPRADRAVALAWIEHVTGDIHQPLHALTMHSPATFPDGDYNGGRAAVRFDGEVIAMHKFWDGILGSSDAYPQLDLLAQEVCGDAKFSPDEFAPLALEAMQFDQWAKESYDYAAAVAHLNGRLRPASLPAFEKKQVALDRVPVLPPSYAFTARELARRRAAQAGYRLAEQVRRIIKTPAAATAPPTEAEGQ